MDSGKRGNRFTKAWVGSPAPIAVYKVASAFTDTEDAKYSQPGYVAYPGS
jgi:hypothetical protein